uniref:SWIM-type domain-containing protein n=1 Tax=Anopheles epiroticus TaxID=199890 RepID=A0A182PGP2_9DIPT
MILDCKSTAEAVPLLKEAIDSLRTSEDEKLAIKEKQSHPAGPLVQRVAYDLFIVGHWQTAYGLHHVAALKRTQKYSNFQCDCCDANDGQQTAPNDVCWHVSAVVAALRSAPGKYGGERWTSLLQQFVLDSNNARCQNGLDLREDNSAPSFEFFLAPDDGPIETQSLFASTIMELFNDQEEPGLVIDESSGTFPPTCIPSIFAGGDESLHLMDCQIELMDELDPTDRIDFCPSFIECADEVEEEPQAPEQKLVEITAKKAALKRCGRMAREKLTRGSYSVRKLMKVLESNGIIFNRLQRGVGGGVPPVPPYEAVGCSLSFTRWLESVIEQLNSVIDYNSNGRPDVQSFRIHEDFFRCLRARFSVGNHLRQPEPIRNGENESYPQVYKFTHHKSLLHVFRTDEMALCFEKAFHRTANDRYTAASEELTDDGKGLESFSGQGVAIRPHRYTTYIKLGRYKHEPNPDRVYHFTIEWIAGALPRSRFGDMRISFEYGHRMNNQYMPPPEETTE